ncbi:TPA: hypothetical protein HA219_03620 [Candidatus Woesearchaeota archaeon]|nr:hypothetical protein [Candidatus Woesearchaeota archaeon]HIH39783.1 hypothetical protein [Candidatus Woesearchaeota archaeon]
MKAPQEPVFYFDPRAVRQIQEQAVKEYRKSFLGKAVKYVAMAGIAGVIVTGAGTMAINAARKAHAGLEKKLSTFEKLPDGRIKSHGKIYFTKEHVLTGSEDIMKVAAGLNGKKWDENTMAMIFALNGGDRMYKPGDKVTLLYQK